MVSGFVLSLSFEYLKRLVGKFVDLPPESEEVAGFYGAMLETDHAKDATFNKNFFDDWSKILKKHPPVSVTIIFYIPCTD